MINSTLYRRRESETNNFFIAQGYEKLFNEMLYAVERKYIAG